MKKIESFEELPTELLEYFEIEENEKDDLTWEEWEDELISMIKDCVGFNGEPKRKDDWYYHTFKKKFGKKTVVAKTKQYIKDFPDVICYEEPHGLFIPNMLGL